MLGDPAFAALREPLAAGLQQLGLEADTPLRDRLLAYLALISRWNRVYNLSAVREPGEMLTHHLLDSLSTLPALESRLPRSSTPRRVLDVGSGAGLPGVVIALMRPDFHVTCIDAVAKKAGFLRHVAAELGLSLRVLHGRVEASKDGPFDLITSRAFASLANFVQSTAPLLAEGGVWMAMKGRQPQDELAALPKSVRLLSVQALHVPELSAERCLVWMNGCGASDGA